MTTFEQEALDRLALLAETWTIDELRVERDRYLRHGRKTEADILQRILEKQVAEDSKPALAQQSSAKTKESEKLKPAEARKKAAKERERRLRIASRNGTIIPFALPE